MFTHSCVTIFSTGASFIFTELHAFTQGSYVLLVHSTYCISELWGGGGGGGGGREGGEGGVQVHTAIHHIDHLL